MEYKEHPPHFLLRNLIDCYWTMYSSFKVPLVKKIIPDGCVDIILNFGEPFNIRSENFIVKNEQAILAGPMKHLKYTEVSNQSRLLGIRFKPYGFHSFYKFDDLNIFQDISIALDADKFLPDFVQLESTSRIENLNRYFLERLNVQRHYVSVIAENITFDQALNIPKIALEHNCTMRTLERQFLKYAGMSLKSYHSIMKIQHARKLMHSRNFKHLNALYFELNYYDNSHFTKEFKRITGDTPESYLQKCRLVTNEV